MFVASPGIMPRTRACFGAIHDAHGIARETVAATDIRTKGIQFIKPHGDRWKP